MASIAAPGAQELLQEQTYSVVSLQVLRAAGYYRYCELVQSVYLYLCRSPLAMAQPKKKGPSKTVSISCSKCLTFLYKYQKVVQSQGLRLTCQC